jgi:hypothetical protein
MDIFEVSLPIKLNKWVGDTDNPHRLSKYIMCLLHVHLLRRRID